MSHLTAMILIDSLGTGGAERELAERLPHLRGLGHTPIAVALRSRDEGVQRALQADGFEVHVIGERGWIGRVLSVRRLLRTRRPDVLETVLFHSDLVGRLAAVGTGVPVVTRLVNTDYDPIRLQDPALRRARFHVARVLDGWTARHLTRRLYANSEAVRAAAVRDLRLDAASVTVIPEVRDGIRLGRPGPERRAAARAALGLDGSQEVLVTVGRQDYQKGHVYLLEAMARLVPSRPGLTLLVAGRPGDSTPRLEARCATLGVDGHVRFLGHREDVPEVLAAGDLFVFPTLYEGLPGAVVEAMALGLPIVASDIGPVREAVGAEGNARLVRRGDSVALAAAIEDLLEHPAAARELGRRALRQFEARANVEPAASRVVALYREIVSASRMARGVPARAGGVR
jgi:glycosyltransferase involved in cell wall biosynthesis